MHPALDYIALAIATLPASGILAVMCYHAFPALRRWVDGSRKFMRKGRTSSTQIRL